MNEESSVHYGEKPVYEKSSSWWKRAIGALVVLLAIGALVLFNTGCVAFNNGHGQVAPLTAESELAVNGEATVTTEREIVGPDGKVTRDKHTVTKSAAAADLELKSKELDSRRDIGVERERGGGSRAGGFLSWLFTPTYPVYGYSGGGGVPSADNRPDYQRFIQGGQGNIGGTAIAYPSGGLSADNRPDYQRWLRGGP